MTNQEINNFNSLLNTFNKYSKCGINENIEKWILNTLDNSLPFFGHLTNTYQVDSLDRITINNRILGSNKRIKEIKFLKYPLKNMVVKYGRCNFPNQSIFYGTTMILTALNEMKPKVGDLITKTKRKLKT